MYAVRTLHKAEFKSNAADVTVVSDVTAITDVTQLI